MTSNLIVRTTVIFALLTAATLSIPFLMGHP
jgi:hypothetical protein